MDQLAKQCIAESLARKEGEDALRQRISDAHDIICSARYAVGLANATRRWLGDAKLTQEEEQQRIETAKRFVWQRHDPKESFSAGLSSQHYLDFDKQTLVSAVADYFSRPWLRHPMLDWIFLDMTITREICLFGEALKERWLPGPKDDFGRHSRYFDARGDLREMQRVDWKSTLQHINVWFWLTIGLPLGAIWAGFHFGFDRLGRWIVGIFAIGWLLFLAVKFLRFVIRVIRRLSGRIDPHVRPFQLWDEMYEVWRRLEGPVVNPTMVREAMRKATDKGAVWDTVSWSLIDRVISTDGAAWVVERGH